MARLVPTLLGLFFLLVGVGFVLLVFTSHEKVQSSAIAIGAVSAAFGFIGLFGASMAFQSLRGRSMIDGFFMRFVLWIGRHSSPAFMLLAIAGGSLLSLVLGLGLGSEIEVKHAAVLLGAWAAFHLQILLHELGHYIAAVRCEYEPYRVVGGAFSFDKRATGWRLGLNRDWHFLLGGAVFYEAAPHRQSWKRDLFVVVWGPAATLWLIALLFVMSGPFAPPFAQGPVASAFIEANLTFGVITFAVNLFPFPIGPTGLASDGHRILDLLRHRFAR